jgi:tetratricopeptide (TPR) repeat protein
MQQTSFSRKGRPMVQSCYFRPRILGITLAIVVSIAAVLGASTAWAQGQPPAQVSAPKLSDAERARRLRARDLMRAEATRLAQAGKLEDAVAMAVKELAITRELLGELHEDVVASVQLLARLHEARNDWAAARKDLTQVLVIRERQLDPKDWRIADARWALSDLDRRTALMPTQRQRLEEAGRLNRLQDALFRQGKYAEGIGPCRNAMEIRGDLLGENHCDFAESLNNLAALYQNVGDYAKAEPLYRKALEIFKRELGENHPAYTTSLNNLALLYKAMGDQAESREDWAAARTALGELVFVRERQPDRNDWRIAEARRALADLERRVAFNSAQRQRLLEANRLNRQVRALYSQGKYAEGTDPCRKAMEIRAELLGENHPDYAISLNNLGRLYQSMGDYAKAEPLYRSALMIRKQTLGENHPDYSNSLNNLATLYDDMADYPKAEPLFRSALAIRKLTLGESHADYAQSLNNLAGLCQHMGNYTEAEPLFRQALEIRKRALGDSHPDSAASLNGLVGSLQMLAKSQEARESWQEARNVLRELITIRERQPDGKDWRVADARRALGDLDRRVALNPTQRQRLQEADRLDRLQNALFKQCKYAEAIDPCRQAMEIQGELLGRDHPDYVRSLNNLAILYMDIGDYPKSEPLFRQALATCERALGQNHPAYARIQDDLGQLYHEMGDYGKAEPLYRSAREIREQTLGKNHPDYAKSLNSLGVVYVAMGKYAKAEPLYREAIQITKRAPGQSQPNYATYLNNLATLYEQTGDYAKAEPLYGSALEIRERVLSENHPAYATSLSDLGTLYAKMGEYAKAEPLIRRSVEITKKVLPEDDPGHAPSLLRMADLFRLMGEYGKADPLYRRALAVEKRSLGENHPRYAMSLTGLAGLYIATGDHAEAASLVRSALEIRRRALGENHPDYASSLNDLAAVYKEKGEHAKAEPLFREAIEIQKRTLGENHPDYATCLRNLATLYSDMVDYAKAEPLFREAIEIQKRTLGENHPDYAISLDNLGQLYLRTGKNANAEPLFRHALEIRKRALGERHAHCASSLNSLACLYEHMGDNAKAEPLYREATMIMKYAVGENHPDYATSLSNLAKLYMESGDFAKAEPLYREAIEIKKRALGVDHPAYAFALTNLASLYLSRGELATAEKSYGHGLSILTRWTLGGFTALGDRQCIGLLAKQGAALSAYLSVAPAAGIESEELYRHVLAWKGVVEARQDEDRLARDQPELKETLSQLAQARAHLAHLAFTVPPAAQHQAWLQQLGALRDRKEGLEGDLARKSAAFRQGQETRRLGAAEVAAALPSGTALVDLLDYVHFSPPKGGKGPPGQERRLMAFVLRRGQAPVLLPLGASQPIDDAVRTWRQALVSGTPAPMQAAALELRRRVWDPLKPHLEWATTVMVTPDGGLTQFPLAALPGRQPGTYLIEEMAIGYVSSAHRLVETLAAPSEAKPKSPEAEGSGLLAIGGIDYQADPGCASPTESAPTPSVLLAESQRAGFKALAGTGPETQRIGQLFGAAFAQQHALVLTGTAPTEAAVKQQLGRHWRHLHLATHGFFESPARIAALRAGLKSDGFGPGLTGAGSSEESVSLSLAPLLHSGVALAGAAHKSEDLGAAAESSLPEREDGILTAEEVQSLDLRGTELVVLSACDTGLGQGYYGQGVMGLQRAFQTAGARAVVASLWKVDDAATTVLMEQFYANLWSKKMSKLEALRQAQLTVLNDPGLVTARRVELAKRRGIDEKPEKLPEDGKIAPPTARAPRRDPALWAAFVLSGDVR